MFKVTQLVNGGPPGLKPSLPDSRAAFTRVCGAEEDTASVLPPLLLGSLSRVGGSDPEWAGHVSATLGLQEQGALYPGLAEGPKGSARNRVTHRCWLVLPAKDTVLSLMPLPPQKRHTLSAPPVAERSHWRPPGWDLGDIPTPLVLPPLRSRPLIRDPAPGILSHPGAHRGGGRSGHRPRGWVSMRCPVG